MVKANKNDMTASTLVSSIIIVIKITNWKRKYTLPNLASLIQKYTGNRSSQLLDIAARDLTKRKMIRIEFFES